MLKMKLLQIALAATLLAGCNIHEQRREAAQVRWERVTVKAKVIVAEEFFQNSRYPETEKLLTEAIASDPQLASAHLLMGKLQFAQTKIALAEKSFDTAVALDKNMHQGWYFKGLIDQQNKKPADALANYKKAMAIQPDNNEYITAVMQMYDAGQDDKKAIGQLERENNLLPDRV